MVEAYPGEAKRELGTGATADVTVVDIGVVAFKVAFHPSGDGKVRTLGNPFTLGANAELAGLDVNLGVRGRTSLAEQKRERPVLAAEGRPTAGGGVGDGAGFEEAIDLEIDATAQLEIGNHPSLFLDVDGQNP